MQKHLAIQSTYDIFEIGFFTDNHLCDTIQDDKWHTSSLLIPHLEQLLERNAVTLADISFITVNCGPAPFSSLRSLLATANGLHCAISIPLISIDGLNATFAEFYDHSYEHTVVLLNAFNNELYYLVAHKKQIIEIGYKNALSLFNELQRIIPSSEIIHFFGNGVILHKDQIEKIFDSNAFINYTIPQICSLNFLGNAGLSKFKINKYEVGYLKPLHLKKHLVEL